MQNKRILTGMRTTGRLHLGHFVGALHSWLELEREYECYFLLADVQALTTHFDRVAEIEESVRQVVIDWLSVGLDPKHSAFVLQSAVREYPELTTYLALLTSMAELERNPTLKDEIKQHGMSSVNLGFMMYPVSQAADILLFTPDPSDPEAELLVPVGEDQVPHIEMSRDLARAFNRQYGDTFVLPKAKVGFIPRLGDLSGGQKKMGKSYGNAIYLSDNSSDVSEKVRLGTTDPNKARKNDPGNPDICPVFSYQQIFNESEEFQIRKDCIAGSLGCVDCKARLAQSINTFLEPMRDRRSDVEQKPDIVAEAVWSGTNRACEIGQRTMEEVRRVMHLDYPSLPKPS